jgi:PAS domain S-box-containing protein
MNFMNPSRYSRTSSVIQHIVRKIVEFNPAAESTFGFSRDEAIGQTLSDLFAFSPRRRRLR